MFSIELEALPQAVAERQAYLRSLAGHHSREVAPEPFRRRAGRVVVRFGRWVEGRRSDPSIDLVPSLAGTAVSLAGRAK